MTDGETTFPAPPGLEYDDLLMVSYLLDLLVKHPSMFGSDESYNKAAGVAERLRRHLEDERTERRRAFRAGLRAAAADAVLPGARD